MAVFLEAQVVCVDGRILQAGLDGNETITKGVIEDDISRGTQGEKSWGVFGAVAHFGKVPVSGACSFDVVGSLGGVRQAKR